MRQLAADIGARREETLRHATPPYRDSTQYHTFVKVAHRSPFPAAHRALGKTPPTRVLEKEKKNTKKRVKTYTDSFPTPVLSGLRSREARTPVSQRSTIVACEGEGSASHGRGDEALVEHDVRGGVTQRTNSCNVGDALTQGAEPKSGGDAGVTSGWRRRGGLVVRCSGAHGRSETMRHSVVAAYQSLCNHDVRERVAPRQLAKRAIHYDLERHPY
ncbi:hypothetical protein C8J57DRAFT_1232175 [Mycena rebaudengoi]|nr:hypothetical protein C8J57DRAFT_1232175 [Mycena rebaudengoi]